jgi:hypothetical protein
VKAEAPPTVELGTSFSLQVSVARAVKPHAATVPTGTVTARLDGADHVAQLVDGRAGLTLATTELEPGVQVVAVSYSGDTTYAGGYTSVKVNIRPRPRPTT